MPEQLLLDSFLHVTMISRLKCIFACIFNILAIIFVLHYQLCGDRLTKITLQGDCMVGMCDSGRESQD